MYGYQSEDMEAADREKEKGVWNDVIFFFLVVTTICEATVCIKRIVSILVGSPSHTRVTQASFLTPGGKQGRHLVSGRTSTLSSDLFWKDGVTDDGVPRWQNVVGVVGATPFTPTETRHHD